MKLYALIALRANFNLLLGFYDEAHVEQGKMDCQAYDHFKRPSATSMFWNGLTYTNFFGDFYRFEEVQPNEMLDMGKPMEIKR